MNFKNPNAMILARLDHFLLPAIAAMLFAIIGASAVNGHENDGGTPSSMTAPPITFTLELISLPQGFSNATPKDINAADHVFGTAFNGTIDRPFIWVPGTGGSVTFIDEMLSPADRVQWQTYYSGGIGGSFYAGAISDHDQVAATGRFVPAGHDRAFRFTLPSPMNQYALMEELGLVDPQNETHASARDINTFGECVAVSSRPSGQNTGAYWSPILGIVALPAAGYSQVIPREIKDNGMIVGYANNQSRGLYWPSYLDPPVATPYFALGINNQPAGSANAANDNGFIVGTTSNGKTGNGANARTKMRAFRFRLSPPQLADLGDLGNYYHSEADSVNNSGEVVGHYGVADKKGVVSWRAFYFSDATGMFDLSSAILSGLPSGATLWHITRINDNGNIAVAVKFSNGSWLAGILRPLN